MADLFTVNRLIIKPNFHTAGVSKNTGKCCHGEVTPALMRTKDKEKKTPTINFHLIRTKYRVQIKRVGAYPGTGCTAPTERWGEFLPRRRGGWRGGGGGQGAHRLAGDLLLHA